MSGKPKKNNAPANEEPLDDEIIEKKVAEVGPAKEAKQSTDVKKKKSGKGFRFPSVDPIILASFMVFLICSIVVISVTVYGVVAGEGNNTKAEYGSTVEVDYTGYYFYGTDGKMVFDTSLESINNEINDGTLKKSYDYKSKESYAPVQFTVGGGTYLPAFESALIGLKPGQTAEIDITDGYGSLTLGDNMFNIARTGITANVSNLYTQTEFESFFGIGAPSVGFGTIDKTPYGWSGDYVVNSNGTITVVFNAPAGVTEYEISSNVKTKVTANDGTTITFDYIISGGAAKYIRNSATEADSDGMLVRAVFNNQIVYIIGFDGADNITYKTTEERVGTIMHFSIKFVGYPE